MFFQQNSDALLGTRYGVKDETVVVYLMLFLKNN